MIADEVTIHSVRFYNHVPSAIQRIAIDVETNNLAVVRADGCLELWNCQHFPYRQKIIQAYADGSTESVAWCAGRLFSGNLNGKITEHSLNGSKQTSYQLTGGPCWCLAGNVQQTILAAGSEGGYVSLFTLQDDCLYADRILESFQSRVLSLSWLADGSHLVAASEHKLYLCPLQKGKTTQSINAIINPKKEQTRAVLWSVLVLPDFTVVAGDSRGVVSFWDGESLSLVSSVVCLQAAVQALAVSPDGRTIYVAGVDPLIVQVKKNTDTGSWFKSHIAELHTHDIKSLAVDNKGRIYSGGDDTHLGVHYYPPKVTLKLAPHPLPGSTSVGSDYLLLATGHQIEWWRLGHLTGNNKQKQERVCITRIECPKGRVRCCALSPSGRRAAYSCVEGKLRVRELRLPHDSQEGSVDAKVLQGKVPVDARRLQWVTEDALLVVTSDNELQVWEVTESSVSVQRVLLGLPAPSSLHKHTGDVLYTAACDNIVLVATANVCVAYDLTKDTTYCLPPYDAPISAVCVRPSSREGHNVLLAHSDHALRELHVQTGDITTFGTKIERVLQKYPNRTVVRGLSWNETGAVLCLHNDNELMFMNEHTIMNFEWDLLTANKKMVYDKLDRRRLGNGDALDLPSNVKTSDIFVPKRKHSKIINKVDLETEAWRHLIKVEKKENSFVLSSEFSTGMEVACVELTHENVLTQLPPPLAVQKFGAR